MIIRADSRHIPLIDGSVNCIITSPPYWSLRKYDIPDLIWDGDEGCDHEWVDDPVPGEKSGKPGPNACVGVHYGDDVRRREPTNTCGRCGAWRGQLGLEPTIDLYLKHLLQIMDECKRVLRDDGTMWVNLGDSYGGSNSGGIEDNKATKYGTGATSLGEHRPSKDVMAKSLCLIPERFAIKMVNRGWILRNKIIWHKPNCMPSSAKDRFTVDFEPVFFFVKSRKYWFEQQYDAYDKPLNRWGGDSLKKECEKTSKYLETQNIGSSSCLRAGRQMRPDEQGRNMRTVWTISTAAYSEAHFATFPEALVEPMIRAGCPKEICVKCGKAREKIIEAEGGTIGRSWHDHKEDLKQGQRADNEAKGGHGYKKIDKGLTDCGCNADFEGGTVLDPFCGSGTVIKVAEKLQRKGIGIDLGYQELAEKRRKFNQIELIV